MGRVAITIFENSGWLILLYMIVLILDYATGTAVAIKLKMWTSAIAREGIWHKVGCIITIATTIIADWLLQIIGLNVMPDIIENTSFVLLTPIVIIWYILSEVGSILENVQKLGSPIPTFLLNVISLLKAKLPYGNKKGSPKS